MPKRGNQTHLEYGPEDKWCGFFKSMAGEKKKKKGQQWTRLKENLLFKIWFKPTTYKKLFWGQLGKIENGFCIRIC